MSNPMQWFQLFKQRKSLLAYWELLYCKLVARRRQFRPDLTGVRPVQFYMHRHVYIKHLIDALAKQIYHPQPAGTREVYVKKWRRVYDISLTDRLLQEIWVDILNSSLETHLTHQCYAYRKGKFFFSAIRECAAFIRKHKKDGHVDLYILRSDIANYFDSIPVHAKSVLWPSLQNLISKSFAEPLPEYYWQFLVALLRPVIVVDDLLRQNIVGIPTGTPLSAPIANLYLHPLDEYLGSIPGGYYCRYGDDFVFIHPDPMVFLAVDDKISTILDALSLKRNLKKEQYVYLTVAGRPCKLPMAKEKFQGAHFFPFLGFNIQATGVVSLRKSNYRFVMGQFRRLISAATVCLQGKSLGEKTYYLCKMLNEQLTQPRTKVQADVLLNLKQCTDRKFLKQMDAELALAIAEAATQLKGKQAFEKISYHHIRHRFGLISLCQLKNQGKFY